MNKLPVAKQCLSLLSTSKWYSDTPGDVFRHRSPLYIANIYRLFFANAGPGLFDGILTEFKLIIMKIEAAIVARPRFRRVLGKLNCNAERTVRGAKHGGILHGKQIGGTNFQFNRSHRNDTHRTWTNSRRLLFVLALDRLRHYYRYSLVNTVSVTRRITFVSDYDAMCGKRRYRERHWTIYLHETDFTFVTKC